MKDLRGTHAFWDELDFVLDLVPIDRLIAHGADELRSGTAPGAVGGRAALLRLGCVDGRSLGVLGRLQAQSRISVRQGTLSNQLIQLRHTTRSLEKVTLHRRRRAPSARTAHS